MTREERTTAMDKAIEAAARALGPHLRFYGDGHGHAVTIAGKTIKAFLAAIEAAGVRLVPVEELEDLLAGPAAWLDRWAEHVGTCWGGDQCACGLTLARHELAGAREALAASPYAPPSPGAITGIRKAEAPCSDCIDGWCQMNCGPRVG